MAPDEPTATTPMPRCADCGFLTMRNQYTGEWDEMDREYRETGNPPTRKRLRNDESTVRPLGSTDRIYPYNNIPMCFIGARDEFEDFTVDPETVRQRDGYPAAMVLEILQKERVCGEFTPRKIGLTPKDHREMLDKQKMLDWQASESELNRKHEERLAKASDEIQKDMAEATRSAARWQFWGLVIAMIAVGAAILVPLLFQPETTRW